MLMRPTWVGLCRPLFRPNRVNVDAVDTVFAALKGFSPRDCVGAKHVGLGGLCLSLYKEQTTISSARSFEFLFYTIFLLRIRRILKQKRG